MKVTILLIFFVVGGVITGQIDPALRRVLNSKGSADIFISFKAGSSIALKTLTHAKLLTRNDRINTVASALQSHAQKTQENVLLYLKKVKPTGVQGFWINNQIFIEDASVNLVEALSTFSEISEIRQQQIIELEPMLSGRVSEGNKTTNQWGVETIHANVAWALDGGNSGAGIVVANIDSGVRHTHEALRGNLRDEYGWFDPYTNASTPFDNDGHGTHTMGIISGANGIGVAPNSTWITCRGCSGSCSHFALVACGQFMLCPTKPDGSNPDCSKAPHLVSNSWGGFRGYSMYSEVIEAWYAADIVPIFSNGNGGPYCATANTPADHPLAIAVGSTTIHDTLSVFSAKGPSYFETIKPDISAPGTDVISSYMYSDSSYYMSSGTSMACPHAAGVVALLKSRKPDLSVDEVKHYLQYGNAQTILTNPGWNCDGISEDRFPNHAYGSGRINAYNSLKKLIKDYP